MACAAINGRDTTYPYVIGLKNADAQYWIDANPVDGSFELEGTKPGTCTFDISKNKLSVYTVTDSANLAASAGSP